jgi:hypothetical protein
MRLSARATRRMQSHDRAPRWFNTQQLSSLYLRSGRSAVAFDARRYVGTMTRDLYAELCDDERLLGDALLVGQSAAGLMAWAYLRSSVTKSGHTAKWSNAVASAGQSCRNAAFRSRTPDESTSGIGATRQTSSTAWMQVSRTARSCGMGSSGSNRYATCLLEHMIYSGGRPRRHLAAGGLASSYGSAEIAELLRDDRTYRIAPTSGAGERSGRDGPT